MPWSFHVVRLLEKCHGGGIPWSCHKKKKFLCSTDLRRYKILTVNFAQNITALFIWAPETQCCQALENCLRHSFLG